MPGDRIRILFLCTGNSARSIMAEAIANELFGDELAAESAGSAPREQIHPLALATLEAHGLAADHAAPKHISAVEHRDFDLVVTLCDSARATCPTLPDARLHAHWGLPDPPAAEDPDDVFEEIFQVLVEAIESLVSPPVYDLAAKARIVAQQVQQRFPQATET